MAEIWECSATEYHADCSRIGSTMLRTVLDSPEEYAARYIRKTMKEPETKSQFLGTLVHTLVLEPDSFDSRFSVTNTQVGARNGKSKEEFALTFIANPNRRPVAEADYALAKAMADAVLASPCAEWIHDGLRERTLIWDERGLAMKLRSDIFLERPDLEADLVLDIKSSDNPRPELWLSGSSFNPIRKYKYDVQGCHYVKGTEDFTGRRCSYGLIVVGSSYPHHVFLYDCDNFIHARGARLRHLAINTILRCQELDAWVREDQFQVHRVPVYDWDM